MNLYETEKDSRTQRTGMWLPRRKGLKGWSGKLGLADVNYYLQDG